MHGVYLGTGGEAWTSMREVDLGPMTDGTEQSFSIGFEHEVMDPARTELVFTCQQKNGSGRWDAPSDLPQRTTVAPRRIRAI